MDTLVAVLVVLVAIAIPAGLPAPLTWLERKIVAGIQDRVGPNLAGPKGLLQPLADALKLITKEDLIPARADRYLFLIAPLLLFVPALLAFAVVPFGPGWFGADGVWFPMQGADLSIGFLFLLAVAELSVYGLAFGGWSANSKFPQFGAVRSTAQVISYSLTLTLAVVAVVMVTADPTRGVSGLRIADIVWDQVRTVGADGALIASTPLSWNCFRQPLAFLLFGISAFAETNRLPFDLPEAEPELVGGYHTEYSGMRFGMFQFGEYAGMVTMSALTVTLFLGGWHLPGMPLAPGVGGAGFGVALLGAGVFLAKLLLVLFFFMWVRWTLPRFRYDQLMNLGWKVLLPLGLINLGLTALFVL